MPLPSGVRLGPYEIVALIGAGGMGEVYRARDSRLGRDVAIKVLPGALAGDAERLARFEREARTLASLNHPNIAQIYGLEPAAGAGQESALVMELVDGEDLSERIARGPLPVDEALAIARQVADALDAAHALGIVHRDLKPGNVKLRHDGAVKVLDFGLAKALEPAGVPDPPLSNSPTITSPVGMTMIGVILGTAAYMSPEQARGRPVDKRADIWAFGCLLYEMMTGRPAFEGDTVTDVLGAIVKMEPDWSRLPAGTPPRVTRLLRHCLRKDPSHRLRDIGDAIAELDRTDDTVPVVPVIPRHGVARRWALIAVSIAAVAIAAGAAGYISRSEEPGDLLKYYVALQTDGGDIRDAVISPDGRRVAIVSGPRLSVQDLGDWRPRELAGTEAATKPFWSPDGRWIAYFRSEGLLKVPASGGSVIRIATLPPTQLRFGLNSGAWGRDGRITVSMGSGPLLRVPEGGGTPEPIPMADTNVVGLRDLELLPGGQVLGALQLRSGVAGIAVLDGDRLHTVLDVPGVRQPAYSSSGHLLFQRFAPGASIWAVPFSADRLAVTGEAFLVGPGAEPTVAGTTVMFRGGQGDGMGQLAWFGTDGTLGARIGEPRQWLEGVAIAPDGRRLLASATDGIWLYDAVTGARSRVTTGTDDISPAWVDANTMVFVRFNNEGTPALMIKTASTLGGERVLAEGARFPRVTADGRRIVFNMRRPGRLWEIAWIDLHKPSEVHVLPEAHYGGRFPSVSPDGKIVAYVSGELGSDEVFVTRMPSGEGKWQVSTDGGGWTYYSPVGDGVFYRAPDGVIMLVPISDAPGGPRIGSPRRLFEWGPGWAPFYDLAADGKRGITAVPPGRTITIPKLSVIQNWHREFQGR
jgi:Tol biopolymer transport system component